MTDAAPRADALREAAARALRAGRHAEALAAHAHALEADPRWADGWYNLGYLQQQARQFEHALQSYERALAEGVSGPEEVHLNRATVLAEHLRRSEDALAALKASLHCNPRYVPALVNLGNLHEQRGHRDDARGAYEAALALDPGQSLALARLPNLTRTSTAQDPLVARLRQAIARPGTGAAERADLGFGLGKALDDAGAYDDAFAAYAQANAASRVSAGPAPVRYDRAAHERFVDRLIALFDRPVVGCEADAAAPVFICGMFRSGSTLIEQVLASHPRVTAGGEIDLLPEIAARTLGRHLGPPPVPLDDAVLRPLRQTYRDGIALRFPGADVLTDKRPDNFLHIGLIKSMFPRARILHTCRSVLDNCLSVYFLHLSHSMPYALDLQDIAHWYRQYRRLMAHWKSLYGDDIHDVDYDALVSDPRPAIEGALAHCGLDWSDACLDFHATPSVVMTPSAWQVRQPLYTRSSGRWRHYERHLGPLREALGDLGG